MNRSLRAALFLLINAFLLQQAHAGEQVRSSATIAGFESLVLLTDGASADEALPMIIGLHYSSARPETIAGEFDAIDFPARILLPRGNHPRRDGYSWFAADHAQLNEAEQAKATLAVMDEISAYIDEAVKRYPTIGKPAVMGISYGGDLSYLIAVHRPGQISAAFPVAARFPAAWLPDAQGCKAVCPKIVVMHGTVDAIVPIEGARDAARRLNDRSFRVELREFPDVGHDFTATMKADFTRAVKAVFEAEGGR